MSDLPDESDEIQGEDGLSGEEEESDDQDDEAESHEPPPAPPRDEQHATIVAYVARRKLNTVDTKPGGYAWFSA